METQSNSPQDQPAVSADALLADAERRQKLERDLVAMGLNAEEIRRLLNADSHTTEPAKPSPSAPKSTIPLPPTPLPTEKTPSLLMGRGKKANPNRVTADHLHSFAAELMTKKVATQTQSIKETSKELPEFRESSMQERREAEALLREAHNLRRRERFGEAEQKCRQALELVPKDAPALELLGDILTGVAKLDEALAAYQRATEADPRRTSAEKKYGDLLVRQQDFENYDPEAVQGNDWVPTLLSALLPGAGQCANGEWMKGVSIAAVLGGIYYFRIFSHTHVARKGTDWDTIVVFTIMGILWVYAISDALSGSKRQRRH